MSNTTYTPEQMKLSTQFAQAWNHTRTDKKAMFEALMSAVIFGMEVAEQTIQLGAERPSA